jgi:hypothetical protein
MIDCRYRVWKGGAKPAVVGQDREDRRCQAERSGKLDRNPFVPQEEVGQVDIAKKRKVEA